MYYPYFRGKQYELIAIRECSHLLADGNIIPIIEPVRAKTTQLEKCLAQLQDVKASAILVLNPNHGELSDEYDQIVQFVLQSFPHFANLQLGYIVNASSTLAEILAFLNGNFPNKKALIHYGFSNGKELADAIEDQHQVITQVFIDRKSSRLYQDKFETFKRVLVRDGFISRKNRDYPNDEFFSDLYLTYSGMGYGGFGDFSIVGDDYSEGGGPAYAVAIHMTYVDDARDGELRIMHFVSDSTESPVDPAGKFLEALDKLRTEVTAGGRIAETPACKEFLALHAEQRFPGLGIVKKLSMKHHLQLLAQTPHSNPAK